MDHVPTHEDIIRGSLENGEQSVTALHCGCGKLQLHPGALKVLQRIHQGEYKGMKVGIASSAVNARAVRIAKAAIRLLEIVPGVSMQQVIDSAGGGHNPVECNVQIGRTFPLSPNKGKTHFPILQRNTGIAYSEMLFFDDCTWGDNCATVARLCPGVITQKTPHGLTEKDWEEGLAKFARGRSRA